MEDIKCGEGTESSEKLSRILWWDVRYANHSKRIGLKRMHAAFNRARRSKGLCALDYSGYALSSTLFVAR